MAAAPKAKKQRLEGKGRFLVTDMNTPCPEDGAFRAPTGEECVAFRQDIALGKPMMGKEVPADNELVQAVKGESCYSGTIVVL